MFLKLKVKVTQLCPTLCDPMDCSLPGSSVRGIFQARVLEWGGIAFSKSLSYILAHLDLLIITPFSFISMSSFMGFFATPWTVDHQAPLSMEFSRQEHWSGLPFLSPGYLLDPGIEPVSLAPPSLAGGFFFTTGPPGKP